MLRRIYGDILIYGCSKGPRLASVVHLQLQGRQDCCFGPRHPHPTRWETRGDKWTYSRETKLLYCPQVAGGGGGGVVNNQTLDQVYNAHSPTASSTTRHQVCSTRSPDIWLAVGDTASLFVYPCQDFVNHHVVTWRLSPFDMLGVASAFCRGVMSGGPQQTQPAKKAPEPVFT